MKKYIISGIGGIGKTTLAKKNKDVIDMEIREYKYANWKSNYDLHQWYKIEERIINDNWHENYLKAVKNEIDNGNHKIIFVWMSIDTLEWMKKENINFSIVLWDRNEKDMQEHLQELYTKRGNPQYWIDRVLNYQNLVYEYVKENNLQPIKLKKNENIEQILKEKLKWL